MTTPRRVTYRRVIVPHGTSFRAQFFVMWCKCSLLLGMVFGAAWLLVQWIIAGR